MGAEFTDIKNCIKIIYTLERDFDKKLYNRFLIKEISLFFLFFYFLFISFYISLFLFPFRFFYRSGKLFSPSEIFFGFSFLYLFLPQRFREFIQRYFLFYAQ